MIAGISLYAAIPTWTAPTADEPCARVPAGTSRHAAALSACARRAYRLRRGRRTGRGRADPSFPERGQAFASLRRDTLQSALPQYGFPSRSVDRGGASLIEAAAGAKADVYLSADFKYNDFFTPDGRLVVADVGHFESEYCAIDLLYDIITKKIANFAVRKSERSVNPINYLV